jgi:predicted DNA-binding protein (MmcQ/YjbR family)
MDAEQVRAIVRKLPHMQETVQWGETLVFWVGDKVVGGKMFALVNMEGDGKAVMSFSAGPERYSELLEREGIIPAPYMARIHWVAIQHWQAIEPRELSALLANAHSLTFAKLPRRTKDMLVLPAAELRKLVKERRKMLEQQSAGRKVAGASAPPRSEKQA